MKWDGNWINIITLVFLKIQYKNIYLSSRASVKLRHCLRIDTALYTDIFDTKRSSFFRVYHFVICFSHCCLHTNIMFTVSVMKSI